MAYETKIATDNKIKDLEKYQDELITNTRKMALSLCFNNDAFIKYIKNRFTLMNNSIKRSAGLIQQMIAEQEKIVNESQAESSKLQSTISALK